MYLINTYIKYINYSINLKSGQSNERVKETHSWSYFLICGLCGAKESHVMDSSISLLRFVGLLV